MGDSMKDVAGPLISSAGSIGAGYLGGEANKDAAKAQADSNLATAKWKDPYYQMQQAYKMAVVNDIFKRRGWEQPQFNTVFDNQGQAVGFTKAPEGLTFKQPQLSVDEKDPAQFDPNTNKFVEQAVDEVAKEEGVVPPEAEITPEDEKKKAVLKKLVRSRFE